MAPRASFRAGRRSGCTAYDHRRAPPPTKQRGRLDVELIDLPPAARWREWMLRVEAAIFASARPVPREALVRLVGQACRFDDLIADLIHELRGRPYDLTLVAGGYALRTKTRFAPGHPRRASRTGRGRHCGIDPDRNLCPHRDRLSAAGHAGGDFETGGPRNQPRRHRLPQTPRPDRRRDPRPPARRALRLCDDRKFLEAFGFASLRDLPDLERLKAEGLMQRGRGEDDLDNALGLAEEEQEDEPFPSNSELDEEETI